MICETDPLAGPEDLGNLFEVRSMDGRETIVFTMVGDSATKRVPYAEASLPRELAYNLGLWLLAMAGADPEKVGKMLSDISKP